MQGTRALAVVAACVSALVLTAAGSAAPAGAMLVGQLGPGATHDKVGGPDPAALAPDRLPTVTVAGPIDLDGGAPPPLAAPAVPKADDVVSSIVGRAEKGDAAAGLDIARRYGLAVDGNLVRLEIGVRPGGLEQVRKLVAAAGGRLTNVIHDQSRVLAWLPPGGVRPVAGAEPVVGVAVPVELVAFGPAVGGATSEGVAASNADRWQAAGQRGAGVKVGIIDMGFKGYAALLGTDLPPASRVTARSFVGGLAGGVEGSVEHGTACAEVIHDMAPDAQLFLARVTTVIEMDQALDWLISKEVRVISTSIGTGGITAGDGSGVFADMAARAEAAGILWITSAGNYRQQHWAGAWLDSDSDSYLDFAPSQPGPTAVAASETPSAGPTSPAVTPAEIDLFGPGGGRAYALPGNVVLHVAARFHTDYIEPEGLLPGDGLHDLVIELWRGEGSTWTLADSKSSDADSWAEVEGPVVGLGRAKYAALRTTGGNAVYGIAVRLVRAPDNSRLPDSVELFSDELPFDNRTPSRSLTDLATVASVRAVAAADVMAHQQEPYSSEGPTNGRGGRADGGRLKPDIAGQTNVSTVSYGPRGSAQVFNGTSAAAPHVAGAAALVAGAFPDADPDALWAAIGAEDLGPPGPDNQFGRGLLLLDPTAPGARATASSTASAATPTVPPTATAGGAQPSRHAVVLPCLMAAGR